MKKSALTTPILAIATIISVMATKPALQSTTFGDIHRHYIYSPEMGDTMTIDVWTPQDFNPNRQTPYPVIFMHDGQNLFDANTTWNHQAWEADSITSVLISSNEIEAPVIIGIHSVDSTRIGDLTPQDALGYASPTLLTQLSKAFPNIKIRGNAYAQFISTTLRDSLMTEYNLAKDPKYTSVMGSSMGGLMSIYTLCKYPEIFGNAACLSTHWIGIVGEESEFQSAMEKFLTDNLPKDDLHRIYLDTGDATIDSLYTPAHQSVVNLITKSGYKSPASFEHHTFHGHKHEEKSWSSRLFIPLKFLLAK